MTEDGGTVPANARVGDAKPRFWRKIGRWALGLGLLAGGLVLIWNVSLGPRLDALPPRTVAYFAFASTAAAIAVMYGWRRLSLWRSDRANRLAREAALTRASGVARNLVAEAVHLAAATLEWAVRAELVREDLRDVEEYMLQLAKVRRVSRAIVARRDGVVIAATGAGVKGQRLESVVRDLPPELADPQTQQPSERTLRLVFPIMGLDARIGTLVLE
ncbi:MAG TPA: hypothetical protein VMH39_07995, partial [Gemmatimonadaceae bacterium]|nr:hypothetical protein [Gemmatimonadaceae bacterium]